MVRLLSLGWVAKQPALRTVQFDLGSDAGGGRVAV